MDGWIMEYNDCHLFIFCPADVCNIWERERERYDIAWEISGGLPPPPLCVVVFLWDTRHLYKSKIWRDSWRSLIFLSPLLSPFPSVLLYYMIPPPPPGSVSDDDTRHFEHMSSPDNNSEWNLVQMRRPRLHINKMKKAKKVDDYFYMTIVNWLPGGETIKKNG